MMCFENTAQARTGFEQKHIDLSIGLFSVFDESMSCGQTGDPATDDDDALSLSFV